MLSRLQQLRRVVITGMGCVTPIGIGREAFWRGLLSGESGVRRITAFDVSNSRVQIAAEVRGFDWEAQLNPKDRKHVPRTVPLALAAAREALEDAGLINADLTLEQRRGFGVVLGTGGGGLAFTEQQYEYWYLGPHNKASVYTIPASTHGGLSSELSMAFGLRGLSHIVSTGCTSSTDALAYAAQHIALGRQEMMISGGVDAPTSAAALDREHARFREVLRARVDGLQAKILVEGVLVDLRRRIAPGNSDPGAGPQHERLRFRAEFRALREFARPRNLT